MEGLAFPISADATQAANQLTKLANSIQRLASQAGVSFDQIGADAQQGMTQAGNAMDSFASEAQESFSEAAAAARKYEAQVTAVGKGNDKTMRAMTGSSANIAAQFQDIAVQAQQGTSWMTIALQQGTQMGAAFAGMGAQGVSAFQAIKTAAMSVISPMSLITIGLTAVAAIALQAMMGTKKATEEASKAIEKHEKAIQGLAKFWPAAITQVDKYNDVLKRFEEVKFGKQLKEDQAAYNAQLQQTTNELNKWDLTEQVTDLDSIVTKGINFRSLFQQISKSSKGITFAEAITQIKAIQKESGGVGFVKFGLNMQALEDMGKRAATGVREADVIMSKFMADLALGNPDILTTVENLQKLEVPEGPGRDAINELLAFLQPLYEAAKRAEDSGAALRGTAGGFDELAAAIQRGKQQMAAAERQQDGYTTALQDMGDVVPKVEESERDRLKTALLMARANSQNREQVDDAIAAYDKNLAALNKLNAAERLRTDFLNAQTVAQEGYNDALKGMAGVVPKILQTDQQQIESQYKLALAFAQTKEARDAAGVEKQQALTDLSNVTGYNVVFAQIEQMKAAIPQVTLTLQQQADAWLASANAGQQDAAVIAENIRLHGLLTAEINKTVQASTLGVQFSQLANTSYANLNTVIRQYAQEVTNGSRSGDQFVTSLRLIAASLPEGPLRDAATATADLAEKSIEAGGGVDGLSASSSSAGGNVSGLGGAASGTAGAVATLGNNASVTTGQLYAMGDAAAYARSQMQITATWQGLQEFAKTGAVLSDISADIEQFGKAPPTARDMLQQRIDQLKATGSTAKATADEIANLQSKLDSTTEWVAPKKGGGGGKKGDGGGAAKIPGTDMTEDQLKNWGQTMLETIDPTIKLAEQTKLLDAAIAAGAFPAEQREAAMKKLEEQYGRTTTKAFDMQKTMEQMMTSWGDSVASSLADAIVNGKDLGDVFKDLIKQLIQMALEMLVLKPLMASLGTAMGGMFSVGGGATPGWGAPMPFTAANSNLRSLPAPGMLGSRNATTSGGGTVNSSVGGITINIGNGEKGVIGDDRKAQKFGERMRDVVQQEIVLQSRPGGLLWGGGRR